MQRHNFLSSSLLESFWQENLEKRLLEVSVSFIFPCNHISNSELGHWPPLSGCISTAFLVIRWKRAVLVELCMAPSSRETLGTTPFSSTNPLALVWASMWIIRTGLGHAQAESVSCVDKIVTQAWAIWLYFFRSWYAWFRWLPWEWLINQLETHDHGHP